MTIPSLDKAIEELNSFIGSWNGEDSQFIHEGSLYSEDDVGLAEEAIKKLEEARDALSELNI